MTTDAADPAPEPWVWVPTVPGWIEVAAFATDDAARAHWREMVEPVRPEIGDEHTDDLYRMLAKVRREVSAAPVTSAGLVLTWVEDAMAVWTFSTMVEHVDTQQVNPVALVERGLRSSATSSEDITLSDGRRGVLLTLEPDLPRTSDTPDAALWQCVVAVSLPDHPHDVALVTAASTSRAGTDLLAMAAVSIADGIVVGTEPPQDAEERGVLGGPAEAAAP